jgi:hypothetical protein
VEEHQETGYYQNSERYHVKPMNPDDPGSESPDSPLLHLFGSRLSTGNNEVRYDSTQTHSTDNYAQPFKTTVHGSGSL